jgi:hypothetical protein
MQIDPSLHSVADNYKLLTNLVVPRLHINNFAPIGRLGALSVYCRTTDGFDVAWISYAELVEG